MLPGMTETTASHPRLGEGQQTVHFTAAEAAFPEML